MKPINDYIVERIRIDNIKPHYDFSQPFEIGKMTWVPHDIYGNTYLVGRASDWWCVPNNDYNNLMFCSPKEDFIFIPSNNINGFWIMAIPKRDRLTKNIEDFYQKCNNDGAYLIQNSRYFELDELSHPELVDDIIDEWRKYFKKKNILIQNEPTK